MLLHFIRQSLRHPITVGAVLPSGARLARAMAKVALPDHHGPLRILEVGPGTGPITYQLHQRITAQDHLEVVELNSEFCKLLRSKYPQTAIHEQSVLDYQSPEGFDCIVSGLPLANFPAEIVEAIYEHLFKLLRPEGKLVMFQYMALRHAVRALAGKEDRARMDRILRLENSFEPLVTQRIHVSLNVPPAVVTVRRRPDLPQLTG